MSHAINALEAALNPLFAAGRYRDFFDQAHAIRIRFRDARLKPAERDHLWRRLNRCAEAAKERQSREFAERDAVNLSRWREQIAVAEGYAASLQREIAELAARGGPPAERARWLGRIQEKQARLASVSANVVALQAKINDVTARMRMDRRA